MRNDQIFVLLLLILLPMSGCLDDDSDSEPVPNGDDDENVEPGLDIYNFEIDDHPEPVSSDNNDQLVIVTYNAGDDIQIPSQIQVELTVDGNSMEICQYSAQGDGSDVDGPMCYYSVPDDSEPILWKVGQQMTIGEVEMNYCESSCNLQVEIRDGESESLMGETLTGTAE